MATISLQLFLCYGAIFFGAILLCIYIYFKRSYIYWARRGVPYLEPTFPVGNNDYCAGLSLNYGMETNDWYFELKRRGIKLGGVWSWAKPVLVVTDPDYIRDVLIKDFNVFVNRDFYSNPKYDPFNEGIFVIKNEEWRNTRQNLSPAFTTSKIKSMLDSVRYCSKLLIKNLDKFADGKTDIDIDSFVSHYAIDVIGRVIFGLDFNCMDNEESRFRKFTKFQPKPMMLFNIFLSRICENTARLLGIKTLPTDLTNFFIEIARDNIEYRKSNNMNKNDFTQALIDLEKSAKGKAMGFGFDRIVANKIIFFNAGFGTSAATMKFALYELSKCPEYQEKARKEIREVLNKFNGEFTYDAMQEMTYLRQIVDETLRLYPPLLALTRVTSRAYTFANTNVTIPKDTTVIIPPISVGRDPDYYPEPEKFDPDRFNAENKSKRNPYVYLPFGIGPRYCIGKRIGLIQVMTGLAAMLSEFNFSVSTPANVVLKRGTFLSETTETIYLKANRM